MKYFTMFAATVAAIAIVGCSGINSDVDDSLLDKADSLYTAIKTIVTDDSVQELLSDDSIEKLKTIESVYLTARVALETDIKDADSILTLVKCAEDVITIIDDGELKEKYGAKIAAVRIAVRVLLNTYLL